MPVQTRSRTSKKGKKSTKRRHLAPPHSRARSPPKCRNKGKEARDFKDLLARIHSLSTTDRPMPKSRDPCILGLELKVLLAARAPTFVEAGRRGGKVTVSEVENRFRHVPMWGISPEQDPELLGKVRVETVRERGRRNRGAR